MCVGRKEIWRPAYKLLRGCQGKAVESLPHSSHIASNHLTRSQGNTGCFSPSMPTVCRNRSNIRYLSLRQGGLFDGWVADCPLSEERQLAQWRHRRAAVPFDMNASGEGIR